MNVLVTPTEVNMTPELKSEADPQPAPVPESETTLPAVSLPIDVRGVALSILATIAVIFILDWAQSLVILLLLGILFAYTLNPLVVWLERIRIPRLLGASIVMVAVLSALIFGAYSLRGQVQSIISQLPAAASKLSAGLAKVKGDPLSNLQKLQIAANEVEKATSSVAGNLPAPKQRAMHVVVDAPSFRLDNFLWAGSSEVLEFIGETIMVIFLVYFLLLSGDTFKRKLVKLAGPTLSRRKITVHILDDINNSIQRYMFMLLITNILVGLLCWVAFRWIGLENAGAWAVTAGFLHVIPYFGPALIAAATGMAAYIQFNSLLIVLLVAGASIGIAIFVGIFVTTWMTGRIAKMNAAAVFVSLLFWAWLWGVWGMLLGIPIIVIAKVVSEHVEQLQPVAELVSE